ncbi:MAG: hypothetical protein AB7O88_16580 [Reyranellaceae bacterium]
MSHRTQRYDTFVSDARPQGQRAVRSIAITLTGLAFALGAVASIDLPSSDQVLQDLVFGAILGATYAVTVLGVRAYEFRIASPGFSLLLAATTILWFVGLKHQFAFASATVFIAGQLLAVGLAAALREATLWIGGLLVAVLSIALGWLLFNYLDPRIVLLTGIKGWGNDRLLGSPTTLQAAVMAAAVAIWWLTRRAERPAAP